MNSIVTWDSIEKASVFAIIESWIMTTSSQWGKQTQRSLALQWSTVGVHRSFSRSTAVMTYWWWTDYFKATDKKINPSASIIQVTSDCLLQSFNILDIWTFPLITVTYNCANWWLSCVIGLYLDSVDYNISLIHYRQTTSRPVLTLTKVFVIVQVVRGIQNPLSFQYKSTSVTT